MGELVRFWLEFCQMSLLFISESENIIEHHRRLWQPQIIHSMLFGEFSSQEFYNVIWNVSPGLSSNTVNSSFSLNSSVNNRCSALWPVCGVNVQPDTNQPPQTCDGAESGACGQSTPGGGVYIHHRSECCFLKPPVISPSPTMQRCSRLCRPAGSCSVSLSQQMFPNLSPELPFICGLEIPEMSGRLYVRWHQCFWMFLGLFFCVFLLCAAGECRQGGRYQMEVQILLVFLAVREKPEGVGLHNVGTCRPHWWQLVILYRRSGSRCSADALQLQFIHLLTPTQTPDISSEPEDNLLFTRLLTLIFISIT